MQHCSFNMFRKYRFLRLHVPQFPTPAKLARLHDGDEARMLFSVLLAKMQLCSLLGWHTMHLRAYRWTNCYGVDAGTLASVRHRKARGEGSYPLKGPARAIGFIVVPVRTLQLLLLQLSDSFSDPHQCLTQEVLTPVLSVCRGVPGIEPDTPYLIKWRGLSSWH